MRYSLILLFTSILFLFLSCKKDNPDPQPPDNNPIEFVKRISIDVDNNESINSRDVYFDTYEEEVDYLIDWFDQRMEWMNGEVGNL